MKPAYLLSALLILLTGCATTEQQGIDESQKTRLAETMSRWAEQFITRKWDEIAGNYAKEVDFNGRPLGSNAVAGTMMAFMDKDRRFELQFDPESWGLDSVRGAVYAGHMIGAADYGYDDSSKVATKIGFWLKMEGDAAPLIVAQFDEIGSAYQAARQRYHDRAMAGQDYDSLGRPNYTFWEELTRTVQPLVGALKYYGKHGDDRIFYALDKDGSSKMGIVDEKGVAMIPFEYDDIGGIGVILPDVMEVKKNGKKGLLKLDRTVVLPVEFEAILPIFNDPRRAIWAYRDGSWACYNSVGQPVIPEGGNGDGAGPDWVEYLQSLPLDTEWKPGHASFFASALGSYYGEGESTYLAEYGLLRVPFVLAERHVLQDMHAGSMEMDEGNSMSIDSVFLTQDGRVQMLSTMEVWGIGGRESYHDLDTRWVIFEPELRDTAQSVHLYRKNLDDYVACHTGALRVIGDTLLETVENDAKLGYYQAPSYKYFRLADQGGLIQRLSEREFPFMSLIPIDKEFLQGCYHGSANEAESQAYKSQEGKGEEDYGGVSRTAKFFRADDLDYLVNEVYAAHGFEFTQEKWRNHYKDKKWYKPASSNVDAALTALEKQNIAFVRALQSEMRGKESAYTQESFSWSEAW